MAKFVSLSNLETFLDNSKNLFATKSDVETSLSNKADSSHNHDDKYASKEEFDSLGEQVNNISTDGFMTIDNPYCEGSISMGRWGEEQGFKVGERSVAMGLNAVATKNQSVAFGENPRCEAENGFACGNNTTVQGYASFACGDRNNVGGASSFATGFVNSISSSCSSSLVCGSNNSVQGSNSLCLGSKNVLYGDNTLVHGQYCARDTEKKYAHIVGNGDYLGSSKYRYSNAYTLDWNGNGWFAGDVTATDADGNSVSLLTIAANAGSGDYLAQNSPVGTGSFSMNRKAGTEIGASSTTLGVDCTATGEWSYAEGYETISSSLATHAEGYQTVSSGGHSHAEGYGSVASGQFAHAQNDTTTASGQGSHSEGCGTIAASLVQHAQGAFNIEDAENTYLHIVGNGESNQARSNAHTLDWNGNAWFAGDVAGTDSEGNKVSLNSLAIAIDDITPIDISDIESLFA